LQPVTVLEFAADTNVVLCCRASHQSLSWARHLSP